MHSKKSFRKLYISRNKASQRRLINEKEILPILNQYGFETIYTEDYSFKEQIQLFSQAQIIIGIHGAGLSNMLFMNPNTIVIEIRFEHESNDNCYFSLASVVRN